MTTISGNYNILLGYGAIAPNKQGNRQIVLGSALATTYMSGAGSGSGGLIVNSGALTFNTNSQLTLNNSVGVSGQILTSNGPNASPYWGPLLPQTLSSVLSLTLPLASLYTISNQINPWTLTLPAPAAATNSPIWIKNMSTPSGNVTGLIVKAGSTSVVSTVTMNTGDTGLFESDGTYWYVLSSTFS